jgi:hypothetical protein
LALPSTLEALYKNARIDDSLTRNLAALRDLGRPSIFSLTDALRAQTVPGLTYGLGRLPSNGEISSDTDEEDQPNSSSLPSIHIPKPLAAETNERLRELVSRFDRVEVIAVQAVELVQTMNTAANGLLDKFTQGARASETFSRRSLTIALIALAATFIMPAAQIGYDLWKSYRHDGADRVITQEIVRAQQEAAAGISRSLTNQTDRSQMNQVELVKAIDMLNNSIRVLKDQLATIRGKETDSTKR